MTSTKRIDEHTVVPEWAQERAEMLQGLYIHMTVYLFVNAGLFFINWATRGDDGAWWFYWPLLIWLVFGLGIHLAVTVMPLFTDEWVNRRAERLVESRQQKEGLL